MDDRSWIPADWPAPPQVRAGCSTRHGGQSQGPYASLNLAQHVGDDQMAVENNRRALCDYLDLPSSPHWLRQVHGCAVSTDQSRLDEADASLTRQTNQVCAVMTADCLPVLMTDRQGKEVAAVHAGWRGLVAGAITATAKQFEADVEDLLVWLGPAIGPNAFEVGEDVFRAFVDEHDRYREAFVPQAQNKWLLDIYTAARLQLQQLGIKEVYGGGFCTVENNQQFFSYRRDGITGRMASLIWLAE